MMTRMPRRMLAWLLLSLLAAMMVYAIFRGYLGAELLIGFSNNLLC